MEKRMDEGQPMPDRQCRVRNQGSNFSEDVAGGRYFMGRRYTVFLLGRAKSGTTESKGRKIG